MRRRLGDKAWLIYLVIGGGLIAAYFLLPFSHATRAALDCVFGLAAVLAIAGGTLVYKPERRRPWVIYGIGMTFFFMNNVIQAYSTVVHDASQKEAARNDLFMSVGYVVIIVALLSLIYSRDGGDRDRTSLIDASIVVVGATMLTWVFFMAPFALDESTPLGDRIMDLTYPIANLILLAVSVRLAVSRGTRTPAFFFLLMAMLASLASNTLSLDQVREHGFVDSGAALNIVGLAATLFAGAAPLHPSMKTLTDVGHYVSRLTRARMALFLAASATGVFAYIVESLRGNEIHVPVLLGGSFVIFVLVLLRLASLGRAMRRSEERFRSLIQNASDAFAILDPAGRIMYLSPASSRVVGFSPEELEQRGFFNRVHPDDQDHATLTFGEILSNPGVLYETLLRIRHKDGEWRWLQVSCTNLLRDPAVLGIIANFHDVTVTKEAEEALRVSERNSRLLFESSPLPMWVFDQETLRFLAVNDAAISHYGYSRDEFLTMKITDIRPNEAVDRLLDEVTRVSDDDRGVHHSGEWVHRLKDGRDIDVDIVSHSLDFAGQPASLVVAQDISERKRVEAEKDNLESQLRQSQKLEAVGQLAGGVAHDFNNLLAIILNYGHFVREDLPEDSSAHEDVGQILNAADKAARLVKQLLAFSRREILKPEVFDLNDVVSDIHKMLTRTTKENINIVVDLGEDLWATKADRGQIEQVLLNLAVNADAAMPNGGALQIRTVNRAITNETARQKAELQPGNYVCLSVSDDGTGMSEEVAARAFEPFFTTKGIGEGTGLGLSTVYGIVKQSGGYIYLYSEEGRGTTFNIYLPATNAVPDPEQPSVVDLSPQNGTETILVVEDEEGVRSIAERILKRAGYTVMTAPNPAVALELMNHATRIDLLLTDVIMPGMSGRDLARKLQSSRPQLRTIFMSGYTDEIIARQGVLDDGVTFLQKPFGAEELLPLVRQALNNEPRLLSDPSRGVLIVDDEQPMREVLKLLLESNDFYVIGEAASGEEAVDLARELHPDVVVLDHFMPGMNGADTAPLLREAWPNLKICAFSAILTERPAWADVFLSKERIGELPPTLGSLTGVVIPS